MKIITDHGKEIKIKGIELIKADVGNAILIELDLDGGSSNLPDVKAYLEEFFKPYKAFISRPSNSQLIQWI